MIGIIAAPLALPHTAIRDTAIGGYTIPKDAWVIPNLYACHHDHDVWGDPDNFRPERWIDEHGALRKHQAFIPFSLGMCSKHYEVLGKKMNRKSQ